MGEGGEKGEEKEVDECYKAQGLHVYSHDVNEFRSHAQKTYLEKYGSDWPKDALERINAVT